MYNQLISEGKDYVIKQYNGFAVVMVGLWILIALALIISGSFVKMGLAILGIFLLCFILSKTTHKSSKIIRMHNEKPETLELRFTTFTKPMVFQFEDIKGFDLRKNYWMRILMNVQLFAQINDKGKMRNIPISQAMKVQPMQELLNELEDLMSKKQQ